MLSRVWNKTSQGSLVWNGTNFRMAKKPEKIKLPIAIDCLNG